MEEKMQRSDTLGEECDSEYFIDITVCAVSYPECWRSVKKLPDPNRTCFYIPCNRLNKFPVLDSDFHHHKL